jgi:hypothetical protein
VAVTVRVSVVQEQVYGLALLDNSQASQRQPPRITGRETDYWRHLRRTLKLHVADIATPQAGQSRPGHVVDGQATDARQRYQAVTDWDGNLGPNVKDDCRCGGNRTQMGKI